MKRIISENELPVDLGIPESVEAAYPLELAQTCDALNRGLPTLIECDKDVTPWFYRSVRNRLKTNDLRCVYIDGRPDPNYEGLPRSVIETMINQLREVVRGPVGARVVVLPHLDLLCTSPNVLTSEVKEVITLLYENSSILWLGFKDPSVSLPKVISRLFPHQENIIGISRERLHLLITQKESRKFGKGFDPYSLYGHVSGVNAVRLRKVLSSLTGEDYPSNNKNAFSQLRSATLGPTLTIPNIDLKKDIGGYNKVKKRLEDEILTILSYKDTINDSDVIQNIENLIPRGIIFSGPPGTGKTLFAKAMASALGAAVTVVSGPELKSRWVGESEENLRQIFLAARQSAPAVIIFDEIDSFATARGTYTGSGVEHSMVNQLLTEMDGFRKEELVFVVGTTNFVESLDPALLRPGRFEFQLNIPYPDADDRAEILSIYNKKMGLLFEPSALDYAVKRTGGIVEGGKTRHSGDHIQALCRKIARQRIRNQDNKQTTIIDIEKALSEYTERPELTKEEERTVAIHESGHAICSLFMTHSVPIDRISIRGDFAGALGFVSYEDPLNKYVVTESQLRDNICILFGGREAELLILNELSVGSMHDIERATSIAKSLVEDLGVLDNGVVRKYKNSEESFLSEKTKISLDENVSKILDDARIRARNILIEQKELLLTLYELLIKEKTISREGLTELTKNITIK